MAPTTTIATALERVVSALPGGGEARTGQRQMAEAVAKAISTRTHLVVQAGTGTGKSLGYLVPLVLSGTKAVVATATKALQDQIASSDLPLARAVARRGFSWAVLKGRANYLCRQRLEEMTAGSQVPFEELGGGDGRPSSSLATELKGIIAWNEVTTTGDRAELPFEPSERAWSMLSVGPRECPGAFRCPSGPVCFAEAARDRASAADVVVVNTHLYGAHLAAGSTVLPDHEVVVFDEAHQVEDIMTSCLGAEVTAGRLRAVGAVSRALINEADAHFAEAAAQSADHFTSVLEGRLGIRLSLDGQRDRDVADMLVVARARIDALIGPLRSVTVRGHVSDGAVQRALSAAGNLAQDLARLVAPSQREVVWVDGVARAPVLRLSPIDVRPDLGQLWGEVTAILTSATIPTAIEGHLGLDVHDARHLDVGTPFDFANNALLYVAAQLPDRRSPQAEAAMAAELAALIRAAGGRTLALFTSRRATEEIAAAVGPLVPYRILVQGQLPKARLIETFAKEESSCLFATLGFWQGVDVPGRSLSLVTLDRLPFPRPGDPVIDARREAAGENAFGEVDLPRAATLLAQGVGRLIRSASDRGVVAVLDPRLARARYRSVLLDALPPMAKTTERSEAERFLARILA
ncbi:MAG: ATP-dependent DNA helicase [Acidimicrobiales bacterium]